MKKMLIASAIMACAAIGLRADPLVKTDTISTVWGQSVYTNYVTLDSGFSPVIGGSAVYRPLFKVAVKNNSASTTSTAVAMEEIDSWTTLTGSPVTAGAVAVGSAYPMRLVTDTSYGWGGTNGTVALTNTNLRPVSYLVHRLRLITTQNSTNAPSTIKTEVLFQ